jgi:hypothetical protein
MSSDKKPAKHLTVLSGKTASDSSRKTLASAENHQPMSRKENRPEVVKALVEMLGRIQEQNTQSKKGQKKGFPLFLVPRNRAD